LTHPQCQKAAFPTLLNPATDRLVDTAECIKELRVLGRVLGRSLELDFARSFLFLGFFHMIFTMLWKMTIYSGIFHQKW
jgi:ABC-type polysaccharide/polyol phosphate export permease